MRRKLEEWMEDPQVDKIAQVCYAAMREWSIVTGQDVAGPWKQLSVHHHAHVRKVVAQAFASTYVPTAKELHQECYADGLAAGWTSGPTIDLANKRHPDVVTWEKLSFDQRMKDFILSSILRAFIEG